MLLDLLIIGCLRAWRISGFFPNGPSENYERLDTEQFQLKELAKSARFPRPSNMHEEINRPSWCKGRFPQKGTRKTLCDLIKESDKIVTLTDSTMGSFSIFNPFMK